MDSARLCPGKRSTQTLDTRFRLTEVQQYYIPDLDESSKKDHPHFKLEYTTLPGELLQSLLPHKQLPKSLLKGKKNSSKYLPYEMEDLTIGSWVELARRLGDMKEKKLRKRFRKYMYLGGTE